MRLFAAILFACLPGLPSAQAQDGKSPAVQFHAIDIHIDTGNDRLGGYQIHLKAARPDLKIVSIEGGDSPAFREPPKYDPKAIQRNEVKLAAFTTLPKAKLSRGRTRVATLHVMTRAGDPAFIVRKQVIASTGIERIDAVMTITKRNKEKN